MSDWVYKAQMAQKRRSSGILATLPKTAGALDSGLLNTIYDAKAISPQTLRNYWKRTGQDPEKRTPDSLNILA